MTSLALWNWLKPLQRLGKVGRKHQRRGRVPRSIRLRLESLEDRMTPTVFTPTVFTDGTAGGTLREAIISANNDAGTAIDTVQLSAGTYTLNIANVADNHDVSSSQGDLNITSNAHPLIIQGTTDANGKPTTIINQTVADRVFEILNLGGGSGATVTFKNLIIEGGDAEDNGLAGTVAGSSYALGGGILDVAGNVTLSNAVVQSNKASAGVGFRAQGGGVFVAEGSLSITNSIIQNNKATGGQAAPKGAQADCEADGGGVYYILLNTSTPQLSIINSTVANNTAQGGAGTSGIAGDNPDGSDANGGGVYALGGDPPTLITGSTLSGNKAIAGLAANGGVDGFGEGGGLFVGDSSKVVNSTIAANTVNGGSAAGGGVFFNKAATGQFTNVTVTGNQAKVFGATGGGEGGGLDNNNGSVKDVTLTNTIVAGNSAPASAGILQSPDLRGQLVSGGHNLIGIADGVNDPGFTLPGDKAGSLASPLDAKLGTLQNNGGPTQTIQPLSGSPALGGGDPSKAPSSDQRGQPRPSISPTDIGAVQVSAVNSGGGSSGGSSSGGGSSNGGSSGGGSSSAPKPPPTLQVPPLLAFLNSLLGGIETVNSNGTETVTDSIFGSPLIVSTFDSTGHLVRVTLFGIDITFLFG